MGSATSKQPQVAITSVRIEQDKLKQFRVVAEAHRRSVSQEIRWLIDRAVEEYAQEKAA